MQYREFIRIMFILLLRSSTIENWFACVVRIHYILHTIFSRLYHHHIFLHFSNENYVASSILLCLLLRDYFQFYYQHCLPMHLWEIWHPNRGEKIAIYMYAFFYLKTFTRPKTRRLSSSIVSAFRFLDLVCHGVSWCRSGLGDLFSVEE